MFSVDKTPNQNGKIAVVTGANSGLGKETASALAAKGAHVIMASRNIEKGLKARAEILLSNPKASLEVKVLDLGSLESIANFSNEVKAEYKKLDFLINNAGLMAMPQGKTKDGFETQFGVNHLGHWALTGQLFQLLKNSDRSRIVTVTSSAHHLIGRIKFNDPHMRKKYNAWNAYSQSKLANYYFALGLHKKLQMANSSIMSLLSHPGFSKTNLQIETVKQGGAGFVGRLSEDLVFKIGMTPAIGALPQIRAALDPKAKSGEFYAPRYFVSGAPVTRPFLRPLANRAINKLWELSERETGVKININ